MVEVQCSDLPTFIFGKILEYLPFPWERLVSRGWKHVHDQFVLQLVLSPEIRATTPEEKRIFLARFPSIQHVSVIDYKEPKWTYPRDNLRRLPKCHTVVHVHWTTLTPPKYAAFPYAISDFIEQTATIWRLCPVSHP
jgi:hypothetical protein